MDNDRQIEEARILLIDDEPINIRFLEKCLTRSGYTSLTATTDPREGCDLFHQVHPDLVLLDLHMPVMTGFEVMEEMRVSIPEGRLIPVIVLTGDHDPELRRRALATGAKDYLTKPLRVDEVLLRIRNLLETRFLHLRLQSHNQSLEAVVRERTQDLEGAKVEILQRLALAAEFRDDATGQHADRVGVLSARLAEALGLPEQDVKVIRQAATLHDVGKIGIPDSILLKPGPLTDAEYTVMKSHTIMGGRILSGSQFPMLQMAREIALTHHERWNGEGYPGGLAGDDIPQFGRIVSIADAFDSMTSHRCYRQAAPVEAAVEELERFRGVQFDPDGVDAFLQLLETDPSLPMAANDAVTAESILPLTPLLLPSELDGESPGSLAERLTRVAMG